MARLRQVVDDEARIHRVIITVRSDFEPQVSGGDLKAAWNAGRCTVPPFSLEELKEVIVMPTMQEVLIFDPPELVDEIVGDVVQSPGALPLLAYALSELYEAYRASGREDRALRKTDYERSGRRDGRAAQQGRQPVSVAAAGASRRRCARSCCAWSRWRAIWPGGACRSPTSTTRPTRIRACRT